MIKIALGIEYDGSFWHGWQTQPEGQTVQDQLEQAITRFLDQPTSTVCAGRTDSGVHALGQIVHLNTDKEREIHAWIRGINTYLPESIVVRWAQPVAQEFHARFSASQRHYEYWIYWNPIRSALLARRTAWVYVPLDIDLMRKGAQIFLGTHDFSAFRSSECQARSPVRTLTQLQIDAGSSFIRLRFSADAFLHHMVRNIVGSLVYLGMKRQSISWLNEVLTSKDRTQAAPTFPPSGLYLTRVEYPSCFALPDQTSSPFYF